MEDKEIIDGVGCAFYNNGKCENPNGMSCNCINNAVCYYKELKRLEFELKVTRADYEASEQENARLKNERTADLVRQINGLKAENDFLRSQIDLYKFLEVLFIKNKICLQEIKAIAENAYCLTNYTNKDMANFAKQILDLTTKAEEE